MYKRPKQRNTETSELKTKSKLSDVQCEIQKASNKSQAKERPRKKLKTNTQLMANQKKTKKTNKKNHKEQIRNTRNTWGLAEETHGRKADEPTKSEVNRCRWRDTVNRAVLTRLMWDRCVCGGGITLRRSTRNTGGRQNTGTQVSGR